MRAAWAAAASAVLAAVLASGCYKPSIKSGGFQCAPPNNACPDGFKCDTQHVPPVCVNGNVDGGAGAGGGKAGAGGKGGGAAGSGGHAGSAGQGGTPATGGGAGAACLAPVTKCTPSDAGVCDPACNTGCPSCDQKCSVNAAGTFTCNPPTVPTAGLMQRCDILVKAGDVSTQTDNCAPGQVCIEPTTCGQLCYQFCRSNSDCASLNCGRDIGNGVKVCDVPTTNCDPTITTPCGSSNLTTCYISGDTGRTLCDCQNNRQLGTIGDPCAHSRDCYPGLVCYNRTGRVGESACRRVCRLPTDGGASDAGGSTCALAADCQPMAFTGGLTSAVWGYCNE